MRPALPCGGIHHSGKANAREKTLDQYSGRGGSALADGARMVAVLQPLDAGEWHQQRGAPLQRGETGLVMALPKLSYAKQQGSLFIRRDGYRFTLKTRPNTTPSKRRESAMMTCMPSSVPNG